MGGQTLIEAALAWLLLDCDWEWCMRYVDKEEGIGLPLISTSYIIVLL